MNAITHDGLTLSDDQQAALDTFYQFLSNSDEKYFVLEGYSGTGKSTLIKTLIARLPGYIKMLKLVMPDYRELEIKLTATTNKAAETFSKITDMEVSTIHSFLSLIVNTDFKTGETNLQIRTNEVKDGYLLFIDEASYIDMQLLGYIRTYTGNNCKVVFIGDRAQLLQVKSTHAPVFHSGFPGAMLSKVMRQAEGNPIIELATMFREVVNGGEWRSFKPDQQKVIHLPREEFEDAIIKEFTKPHWHYEDSKILLWTNKTAIAYNNAVTKQLSGDPEFAVEDYVINNKYISNGSYSLKTDELVRITKIEEDIEVYGVKGNYFTINGRFRAFMPKSIHARNERLGYAKSIEDTKAVKTILSDWLDLRGAFAQTINKSQGCTYKKVFIDLDNIRNCHQGNTLARLMYVSVSRASQQVYLTGDLA